MKRFVALTACLLTSACGTMNGGAASSDLLPKTPLSFSYHPPKTKLALGGDVVLTSCRDTAAATATFKITPTGVGDQAVTFKVDGDALASAMQKRDLKLELTESGALKSLNATSSDRTGAVISNVLKIFTTIATAAFAGAPKTPGGAPQEVCNEATMQALIQAANLRDAIFTQRKLMGEADPADAPKIAKRIDALATRLASVTLIDLTIPLSASLDIGDGAAPSTGQVRWTLEDLGKWFAVDSRLQPCVAQAPKLFPDKPDHTGCQAETDLFALDYTITGKAAEETAAKSKCLNATTAAVAILCGRTIVMVEPAIAEVKVTAASDTFIGHKKGEELAKVKAPISQWGAVTYLPLNVGFAQSRTIGLTFDEFGRAQTFNWSSEASAENATAALADIATNGVAAAKATKGPTEVAQWTEENARLETQMKNNLLKSCKAAIEAGATACPAPAPAVE